MGIVMAEVSFDGQAPELSVIANKVTELVRLPLQAVASDGEIKGDLYDMHARLAFDCAPDIRLEIYSYLPGSVRKFYQQFSESVDLPFKDYVEGINETEGIQKVYLRGFVGQEPTLFFATELALESLGGRCQQPIGDEERRQYGAPISPSELEARRRKLARQNSLMFAIGCLSLPFVIPVWVFSAIVMAPWRLRKAWRIYRSHTE